MYTMMYRSMYTMMHRSMYASMCFMDKNTSALRFEHSERTIKHSIGLASERTTDRSNDLANEDTVGWDAYTGAEILDYACGTMDAWIAEGCVSPSGTHPEKRNVPLFGCR